MYEPSRVRVPTCSRRLAGPSLATNPASHLRVPTRSRRHMAKPFAADLSRWLRLLAKGRARLRAAWQLRCTAGRWNGRGFAGMQWNAPECARMGFDAPAQGCTPHSPRYTYSSCYRIILKGCRPITILKKAPNNPF